MTRRGGVVRDAGRSESKAANVAAFAREDVAKGTGSLSPRAVIAAVNAELEKNRGHLLESRRQELLRQRDEAYQRDFEASERAAVAARAEPAAPRDSTSQSPGGQRRWRVTRGAPDSTR